MKKLTEPQQEQLKYLQDNHSENWFTTIDVFPNIKRGDYALHRLEGAGLLESRYSDGEKQYRLIPLNQTGRPLPHHPHHAI